MFNKRPLCKAFKYLLCCAVFVCMVLSLCSCVNLDSILDTLMEQEAEGNAVHDPADDAVSIDDVSVEMPDTSAELFVVSDYSDGIAIDGYIGDEPYIKIPSYIDGKQVLAVNSNAIADRELADGVTALAVTDVVVPDTVAYIGASAFAGCRSLKSITLPFIGGGEGGNTNFGYIFGAKDSTGNLSAVPESLENVIVGGAVVADNAFKNCATIISVELLAAETVGNNAFADCELLEKVIIPDSVVSIGQTPFVGCSSLSSLRIPYLGNGESNLFLGYIFGGKSYTDNLNCVPSSLRDLTVNCGDALPENAFYECSSLVNVTLNGGVRTVGANAFYLCKKMKTLTVNGGDDYEGFESVGEHSFSYCSSLGTVYLWENIDAIPDYCFYNCASLRTIKFGDEENVIPNTVKTIGEKAFTYCESLMSISLPHTVSEISDELFAGCAYLSKVTLPDSVTRIGNKAFNGCSNLSTVVFGAAVTEIGDYAFSYCTALKEIIVPDTVTSLGQYVFGNCYSLKSAIISDALGEIPEGCFYSCSYLERFDFGAGINVIPDGIDSLGEKAFYGCKKLESIHISEDITALPDGLFSGCEGLIAVNIPSSVTKLGSNVFRDCSGLTMVVFADNDTLTEIGRECFSGCSSLKDLSLPYSVVSIGRYSFRGCKELKTLRLHNGISAIGKLAFDGCDSLVFSVSSESYAYSWLLENGIGGKQLDIDER